MTTDSSEALLGVGSGPPWVTLVPAPFLSCDPAAKRWSATLSEGARPPFELQTERLCVFVCACVRSAETVGPAIDISVRSSSVLPVGTAYRTTDLSPPRSPAVPSGGVSLPRGRERVGVLRLKDRSAGGRGGGGVGARFQRHLLGCSDGRMAASVHISLIYNIIYIICEQY